MFFFYLGVLLKIITANCNGATKDILIIDDLQVLLVNSDKDYGRLLYFFTVMQKRCQIFAVMDKDTASAADLKFIHSQVDTVVTLTGDASPNPFLCNIIKTKYSGKIVHEVALSFYLFKHPIVQSRIIRSFLINF